MAGEIAKIGGGLGLFLFALFIWAIGWNTFSSMPPLLIFIAPSAFMAPLAILFGFLGKSLEKLVR